MTLAAFALLLISSLAWAGLDAARKALGATVAAMPLVVALGVGQGLLLVGWLAATGWPVVAPGFWLPAAGSVAINVVGNLLFVRAVTVSPFSLTVPLLALVPVMSTGTAWLTLGETPGARQLAGIVTIVAGAIALTTAGSGGLRGLLAALRAEPGAPMMLGVAVCWALVGPCDKAATLASSPAFAGMAINMGMGLALAPALLLLPRSAAPSGSTAASPGAQLAARPGLLALACLAGVVAIIAQFEVMRTTMVSLVEAVKRMTGLIMAVLIGRFAFGEPIGARRAAAIAVMALGTALLLL